jgi:hypothetical protein
MTRYFAIVCEGRTGSNLLVDLLGSHPDIECGPELYHPAIGTFKDHKGITHREFLDRHTYKTMKPIRGFKMPINWILDHPDIIAEFRADGYRIIRLERENLLEQFLSVKLATLNSNWCSASAYEQQSLKIDPWEWLIFVGVRQGINWVADSVCRPFEQFNITYEQLLVKDAQASLCQFLGAEPRILTTITVRMRTKPVHEVVENYDELVGFFAKSPYAAVFPPRTEIVAGAGPA